MITLLFSNEEAAITEYILNSWYYNSDRSPLKTNNIINVVLHPYSKYTKMFSKKLVKLVLDNRITKENIEDIYLSAINKIYEFTQSNLKMKSDTITLYRGEIINKRHRIKDIELLEKQKKAMFYSWTRNKKIARSFAMNCIDNKKIKGVVLEKEFTKENIFMSYRLNRFYEILDDNSRQEEEIIIWNRSNLAG